MDIKEIIKNALNLTPVEKLLIIDVLSKSLDEPDKNIDELWKEEVENRYSNFKEGKLNSISYHKILKNDS